MQQWNDGNWGGVALQVTEWVMLEICWISHRLCWKLQEISAWWTWESPCNPCVGVLRHGLSPHIFWLPVITGVLWGWSNINSDVVEWHVMMWYSEVWNNELSLSDFDTRHYATLLDSSQNFSLCNETWPTFQKWSGVIRIGSPVGKWKSWKFSRTKLA